MKVIALLSTVLSITPLWAIAAESYYCPQNSKNISTGMTMDQVIDACGSPLSKQESNEPVTVKIPMQELNYNNMGTDIAFYGVWELPTGSGGTQLQVDVVNNKVREVKVGGSDGNSFSICEGVSIEVGDDVGKVYNACGSPAIVNNTFIEEIIDTPEKPQVWIYQASQYTKPVSLTFVNGKLQSIR